MKRCQAADVNASTQVVFLSLRKSSFFSSGLKDTNTRFKNNEFSISDVEKFSSWCVLMFLTDLGACHQIPSCLRCTFS